jgi:hypothetical protein
MQSTPALDVAKNSKLKEREERATGTRKRTQRERSWEFDTTQFSCPLPGIYFWNSHP